MDFYLRHPHGILFEIAVSPRRRWANWTVLNYQNNRKNGTSKNGIKVWEKVENPVGYVERNPLYRVGCRPKLPTGVQKYIY